jgi:hypothetical protein
MGGTPHRGAPQLRARLYTYPVWSANPFSRACLDVEQNTGHDAVVDWPLSAVEARGLGCVSGLSSRHSLWSVRRVYFASDLGQFGFISHGFGSFVSGFGSFGFYFGNLSLVSVNFGLV